jgi:Fe-S cluster assembly protein SufD
MLDLLEAHFEESIDLNDPLLHWKQKSWGRFCELGWPQPKQEAFQYIPLKHLEIPKAGVPGVAISGSDHPFRIVFVDGFFSEEQSRVGKGIVCLSLDQAMRPYGIFLQNRIARTMKEETDPFAALNGAFQGKGIFLYVSPKVEAKLSIEQLFTKEQMASPRVMLYLGRGAKLEIQQRAGEAFFCNSHFDAVLDENAELIFRDAPSTTGTLFQSIRASLKRNSRFAAHLYSEGTSLARTSLRVQLLEENSEALLQGLWRLDESRQCHIHATIEHLAPHTRSRQHFKGILKGRSRSSFEGKIYVHPTAQKTEAYQLNNNLLLSDEAAAYSKPNLEIFADDVKASHGATIAQLNAEDLFYLRSRGLSLSDAQQCLIDGFCRELIECIPENKR